MFFVKTVLDLGSTGLFTNHNFCISCMTSVFNLADETLEAVKGIARKTLKDIFEVTQPGLL